MVNIFIHESGPTVKLVPVARRENSNKRINHASIPCLPAESACKRDEQPSRFGIGQPGGNEQSLNETPGQNPAREHKPSSRRRERRIERRRRFNQQRFRSKKPARTDCLVPGTVYEMHDPHTIRLFKAFSNLLCWWERRGTIFALQTRGLKLKFHGKVTLKVFSDRSWCIRDKTKSLTQGNSRMELSGDFGPLHFHVNDAR